LFRFWGQLLVNKDQFNVARQCKVSTAVRQDQFAAGILDQKLKAVQGIGNIERHIGNIGLKRGKQATTASIERSR
jgi:hypothetical protein